SCPARLSTFPPFPSRCSSELVNTGDGAVILLQVTVRFLRAVVDFPLPPAGAYGVGLAFLPLDPEAAEKTMGRINAIVEDEGLRRSEEHTSELQSRAGIVSRLR